eukprot:GEMP01032940.1.p1 GENE.GEMP01032940.1~~GEMP01032940.1.p1  ORF type:complete len:418 (+),score=68.01 GEMP01032940.1:155-1408(+)
MKPVRRKSNPAAKAKQKSSLFRAAANAIISSRQVLIRTEAERQKVEMARESKKQQRVASLHGLIFPDDMFHGWHVQEATLQWLSLRQDQQEEASDDGLPKKSLDDLRGMDRMFGVRDAAAKNLPADEYWNQFVKKITSFHQDDEKLLRLLMDEDPDFEGHINELPEGVPAAHYLWISSHKISEYIHTYFADARWLELRARASSPQASDRGKSSPQKAKSIFPVGDTVQSIEAIKTNKRSVSVVFLDICPLENIEAPKLDPRGTGLAAVPDYRHLGLTCSGTSSASTLLFLSRSLRKVLKILKEDGYLIILWGAFIGHPMLFFIKTLLEPLFSITTVLAAPPGSFETVLFFRGFSFDLSGNTDVHPGRRIRCRSTIWPWVSSIVCNVKRGSTISLRGRCRKKICKRNLTRMKKSGSRS